MSLGLQRFELITIRFTLLGTLDEENLSGFGRFDGLVKFLLRFRLEI